MKTALLIVAIVLIAIFSRAYSGSPRQLDYDVWISDLDDRVDQFVRHYKAPSPEDPDYVEKMLPGEPAFEACFLDRVLNDPR
jgi:hypothetical protein